MTQDGSPEPPWPRLPAELVERLALPVDELRSSIRALLSHWPASEPDEAFVTRALEYPWARPAGSFVLEARDQLGPLTPAHHDELEALAAGAAPADGAPVRYPLLAIGSNGAPDTLIRKFEYLPAEETRVLAVAGRLQDFDVGAVAGLVPYGAFPATLVPSPGASVQCTLLWVTQAQLEALTWSEVSYAIGRLAPIDFTAASEAPHRVRHALVYISRYGYLSIDGAPVALEAMPAEGRTARSWSQERLLEWAAGRIYGDGASHLRLLEALAREPVPTVRLVNREITAEATPFCHEAWTPYPGSAPAG